MKRTLISLAVAQACRTIGREWLIAQFNAARAKQ